ncbi:MAG: thioredoxin [Myxococcota bacterium]
MTVFHALAAWLPALMVVVGFGCGSRVAPGDDAAPPATASAAAAPFALVRARPHVPVAVLAAEEGARADADGQKLVIYVGAPWCEPCGHFHAAAVRGDLGPDWAGLRVLEFNLDEDEARLTAAGCRSRMIPLFARVTPDGRCDETRRIMGSVKGSGAVANLTPRVRALFAPPR